MSKTPHTIYKGMLLDIYSQHQVNCTCQRGHALKHQGLDGQQFSLGPKGERLKFQTSMPSRQLAALGLKVKDSNSKKMMNVLNLVSKLKMSISSVEVLVKTAAA